MSQSREEVLFELVWENPVEKGSAFWDVVCAGDLTLRKRLEAILAAQEQPSGFLPSQETGEAAPTLPGYIRTDRRPWHGHWALQAA